MEKLIELETYPVKQVLKLLLEDKTTKKNIMWATDTYEFLGPNFSKESQISPELIVGMNQNLIQPRIRKTSEEQSARTKKHAEVFTPSWICNQMNNYCDTEWFGRPEVFNRQEGAQWQATEEPVMFKKRKPWKRYIDSRRLEITCGEAPFLASRYDAATGEIIPVEGRIGMLDRKLRIVNENAADETEWMKWAVRALQSTYGYEFQGDNLVIARINLLMTFLDNLEARWHRTPTAKELKKAANIIAWNIWQMDGLHGVIPFGVPENTVEQVSLFDDGEQYEQTSLLNERTYCRIFDWRSDRSLKYLNIKIGETSMKFDFVIGNPPYQEETLGENKTYAPPVYNVFMDESYKIGNRVELIHPARFLFNAGSTPKAWNEKILKDPHFKVLEYEGNSSAIFPNTDIKGGIVISYHNNIGIYSAIEIFTPFAELNDILSKIRNRKGFRCLSEIAVTSYAYHFLESIYKEYPSARGALSKGHEYDLKSNVFEKMPQVFCFEKPKNSKKYVRILGRINNERVYRFIQEQYVNDVCNLHFYKVFMPGATGTGEFGETISQPIIGLPGDGATETFLSIGTFKSENEATATIKYIKTKFARALYGILKRTQANTPEKWKYVPLQDFTDSSDIDWSQSVAGIDRQLYKKYGLTKDEINFIETHVKEMT